MDNKTVLYISYDGMTDNLGQSQVIPYLAGLAKLGFEITILSFEKKQNFIENKEKIAKLLSDNSIAWNPLPYTSKPPVLSTLWDIWNMHKTAKKLCIEKNIQIVHCRSYISAIVGLKLKTKLGTKFVFDMRGFWADERVEGNIWNLKNPIFKFIYNYFKNLEINFLNNSDYCISLTEAGKNYIMSRKEIRKDIKIQVIPCCADLNHFNYQNSNEEKKEKVRLHFGFDLDNDIYTYLGSIGTWYLLDEMLDLYSEIHITNPKARFLFLTADKASDIFEKAALKGISKEFIRIQKAQRADLPALLSISKASVFFIKPSFSKTASSPTKMGELMGMGIPLICNSNVGDVSLIMEDTKAGIIVHDFSKSNLQDISLKCKDLESLTKEEIRKGAIKWYSLDEGILKYKNVYDSILKSM
jgi:glycosyltransferase involved in cell wall biosynthesis